MENRNVAQVTDRDGHVGEATLPPIDEPNGRVLVRLDDGRGVLLEAQALERQGEGRYTVPLSFAELVENADQSGADVVIPVLEEEVSVAKRQVEGSRFRITKAVSEREVLVDQPLTHERVDIERVPVNELVDEPPEVRHEGDTMIVPVLEEVVVAEIRLMLREEIHISRRREEVHEPQHVTLRREEVTIDPAPDDTRSGEVSGDADEPEA